MTNREHKAKIEMAKKAIDNLFHDTSVRPETTKESLGELIEHINALRDTL